MAPTDQPTPSHEASPSSDGRRVRRRAVLAAGAASLFGSGCVRQAQSLLDLDSPEPVSLSIKTLPADDDAHATKIARYLADHLAAVGIDARVALLDREELYRDVLLNQQFDLYVARHPHAPDPDFIRPLLHSRFDAESGWQNPFGYSNLELDELLDEQLTQTGAARAETLRDVEKVITRDKPFSVVAFPEEIWTARVDRVRDWAEGQVYTPLRYLSIDRPESTTAETTESRLRLTITDARATENLNPLAVEFRTGQTVVDVLYDSLGRWTDGTVEPWLASGWEWKSTPPGQGERAVVTLREDLMWHDGTRLTPPDVAFTYRFLADTSLGKFESPVPAPNYRGESSLVESVAIQPDGRLEFQFYPASRRIVSRAFTVPVLPEHVWEERSTKASIPGVNGEGGVTEALVWNNPDPVGSGPYQFESATPRESVVFSRFPEHFLEREFVDWSDYGIPFETLRFQVVPSSSAAVELLESGEADATASPLTADDVPDIGRSSDLVLRVTRPNAFYHVGFNVRRAPTSNTRFRRAVASLVDQGYVVDEVFDNYAIPSVSPLGGGQALSPDLVWNGDDPVVPFPGTGGRLDVERARDLFREAGYRYSDSGSLLTR